jgi:hypothetical protein
MLSPLYHRGFRGVRTMKLREATVLFVLCVASASGPSTAAVVKDGDPAFYFPFPEGVQYVHPGGIWTGSIGPANFANVSSTCTAGDTFCVSVSDALGWTITGSPALGNAQFLAPRFIWYQDVFVEVPCGAAIGQLDTVTAVMSYSDGAACYPEAGDCDDPNWDLGTAYYSTTTVVLEVVAPPPSLYILQDSLYSVGQGQTAAYVPFSICNGDPCAPPTTFVCEMISMGHVGGAIDQFDTVTVDGGACEDVYGIVNASMAVPVGTYDTLTIVAWDEASGTVYDTCVQVIHVYEFFPVPLLSPPVEAALVVLLVVVAFLFIRRVSRRS